MPIYEFKCLDCGKTFEKLIFKSEEEKELICPYCKSQKIEKMLSGFYSTCKSSFTSKSSCGGKGFGFS